jgi:hypothetical protein
MAGIYGELASRADFFAMLDQAIDTARWMLATNPGNVIALRIAPQLERMKVCTANGRAPTDDEQEGLTIGLIAARELDDPRADPVNRVTRWTKQLHSLNNYFEMWPGDDQAANATRDELVKLLDVRDARRGRLGP